MNRFRLFVVFLVFFPGLFSFAAENIETGRISGKLMIKDGSPMAGGVVLFFNDRIGPPPSPDRYWRVPDQINFLDEEGRFSVELPEGKYYIAAVKRVTEKRVGPPQEGDYFIISHDESGKQKAYVIKGGEDLKLGVIAEARPFKRVVAKDFTGIEGIVVNVNGDPVEGAIVSVHTTPSMLGLPLFVSDRTGTDGKYLIGVYGGASYYLKVRDVYGGGPPDTGDVVGSYGEEMPVAVTVKTGEITRGIDIKVHQFSGRGPRERRE